MSQAAPGIVFAIALLFGLHAHAAEAPKYPDLPSERPLKFEPAEPLDFERRSVDIPMRDGVKLHTEILIPKGAKQAPILLTRTPYGAAEMTDQSPSTHMTTVLHGYDNMADVIQAGGFIRVVQDVRGKYDSEGDYVTNRPFVGPQNPTPVDHATDTFDSIDWLVKNLPESNDKVGILGISYDGYLSLTALRHPHPALKVSVPMNPMVDGWLGDDWFHHGAFRQINMPYFLEQIGTTDNSIPWRHSHYDQYEEFLRGGSAARIGKQHGLEQLGFWNKILAHPAYDRFWQEQAMDRALADLDLSVPTLIVHGWWDQEDIYGAPAMYRVFEPKDRDNQRVYFVAGPWSHGQQRREGEHLGAIRFRADTSYQFRHEILLPFLRHHLSDARPPHGVAPVNVFETGSNRWQRLNAWPSGCDSGCRTANKRLYLRDGGGLAFEAPKAGEFAYTEYVSDPAKPVPFVPRPIAPLGYEDGDYWPRWLVEDQRHAAARTDVVSFVSEPLTEPLKIAGDIIAHLVASTTGSDSDWVVKLIDVYPDQVAEDPPMGGYQLMISADIFRGRYRESYAEPQPIAAGVPLPYRFALPQANHVFLPGHRLMVQIQSSWFPLYDRNPQSFIPSIFHAEDKDYQRATQRIHHVDGESSFLVLPVIEAN